ncbi:MAG: hypothetical protein KBC62_00630 [Candidatus Pacebacteria bacterium]|nr:hypothetical protein [Candidatus Paceibacterota bacterium]
MLILTTLILSGFWVLAEIFGFYFYSTAQEIAMAAFVTACGAGAASWIFGYKVGKLKADPNRVLSVSLFSFVLLHLLMALFQYFGDQTPHYGTTPREYLYGTGILIIFISLTVYTVVTFVVLNHKARKP